MPTKEQDVIVLDKEDDATPLNRFLKAVTSSETKQHKFDPQSTHSDLKNYSVALVQSALQDHTMENSETSRASHNLSQASSEAYYMRGFSYPDTKQSPQTWPQSSGMKTSKARSATNNTGHPYFATPSWSFTAPTASPTKIATPSSRNSISYQLSGLGNRESSGVDMTSRKSSPLSRSPRLLPTRTTTELADDDDSADEEDLALWMAQDAEDEMRRSSLASPSSKAASSRRCSTISPRNLPITSPFVRLDTFTYNGIPLAEKVYVELQDKDFLRVVHIIRDTSTTAVTLRGWKFRRTRELNGVIDRKLNEVCWILHIDEDDPRDPKLQGMETVPVSEVVKRRRIRLTNQSFPALSWRDDGQKENPETIENKRVLVCRFKYLCFYANAKARVSYEWCEKGFHRLREDECDQRPDNMMKDEEIRSIWRGDTVPGGAQEGWLPGEREFLRQEEVSHRGVVSRSSLKVPSGPDFPMGDPMKRGSVASLLTEEDLQQDSDQATQSTSLEDSGLVYENAITRSNDDVEHVPTSSFSHSQGQQQDRRRSHFNFSGFNGLPVDPSDCDICEDHDISALRRGLRQSSIQSGQSRDISSRIVEIDAQVKTSSSSGTFEKRYEGRITSKYYPTPRSIQRKRSADISFGSPAKPAKRVDQGYRAENLQNNHDGQGSQMLFGKKKYSLQDSASSDSDRTLGRSQSPDSVEEMHTPSKHRGYKIANSGLLTPVSRRKAPELQPSRDTKLPPKMGGFREYTQPLMPSSRTAHSPVVNKAKEDNSGIIDLTRPQAKSHGSFSLARPSISRQPGRTDPFHALSVVSPNPNTTTREKSSRPISAHPTFHSKSHTKSAEIGQESSPTSPGSLPTTPGSSHANKQASAPRFEVTPGQSSLQTKKSSQQNQNAAIKSPPKVNQRRYTFGDCFCGAGGMSRGAVSAGLRVSWGFDFNPAACKTYQMNFFGTSIYNVWANQFSGAKGDHKVDLCHLSPPCQFFSDAHTVQGKDDDMNTASLFAIFNLLEKAKPRVVTLEQTSGLIRRHATYFNSVINMFTSRGFSVRWKVMNCADFGLPQRRTRLFIMTSCPGEALPPFPTPTHSSDPESTGLKPWTTINETISKIPHGWANHDIHLAKERDNPPQSGDKIATCVTTSGGGIIHPCGDRDYTHREFACLQSFPLGHKFGASGVKKQIGNAVPPTVAKVLLETVKNFLLNVDGVL